MYKKPFLLLLLFSAFSIPVGLFFLRRWEGYTPKPWGYPRIVLPVQQYTSLNQSCPYTFAISREAVVRHVKQEEPYWINIHYPGFHADIQITYKPVRGNVRLLREYCADAYTLVTKHQVRASSIQERKFQTPLGYTVVFTEILGPVPSPIQFYVTDGKRHFLRGALYLHTVPKNDYLAPVISFLRRDITHLLETLQFRYPCKKHY